jgi:PAS domain S-box-containing protein
MISRIGKRMLKWVATLVIVPLGLISYINYYQAKQIITGQIFNTLNVSADSLKRDLNSFLESKKKRAIDFTHDKFLRETLAELNQHPELTEHVTALKQHLAIDKIPLDEDIYDILVFNGKGRLASSIHGVLKGVQIDPEYFSLGQKGVAFKSIKNIDGERLFSVSAPVISVATEEFLGVITICFKASSIDNILRDEAKRLYGARSEIDDSEERVRILIVDRTKTIIAGSSESFLGKTVNIEPVEYTFDSRTKMTGEFTGIFGKDRLGASMFLREPDWVIVASVSKDEVFLPVRRFMLIAFLRISIGIVLVIILTLVITQRIAKPILDVSDAADRIAKGHWDERVVVKDKKGEIARLANAFNEMAETLQKSFRAIRHSERLKENIIAIIPSGLIVLNRAFEVLSVNKSFCEMFGVTFHDVIGKPIDDMLREIGVSKEGRDAIAHKDCISDFECECVSPKNGKMILKLSLTNMQDLEEVILLVNLKNAFG